MDDTALPVRAKTSFAATAEVMEDRAIPPAFARSGTSVLSKAGTVIRPPPLTAADSSSPSALRSLTRQMTSSFGRSPPRMNRKCSDSFKAHHAVISNQLKNHEKYVINPRTSRFVPYWDGCVTIGLLFTVFVTPIEVCLFVDTSFSVPGMQSLFVINRLVDGIFGVDVVVNFFLAYQEPPSRGGYWVTKLPAIRLHYLRTSFTVDVLSTLPFDLLLQVGIIDGNSQNASLLRLVRTIRMVRLVKLLRIMRGSRIIARWRSHIGLSYASAAMIK